MEQATATAATATAAQREDKRIVDGRAGETALDRGARGRRRALAETATQRATAVAALVIAASDGLQIQWLLEPDVDIARSLALLEKILEP